MSRVFLGVNVEGVEVYGLLMGKKLFKIDRDLREGKYLCFFIVRRTGRRGWDLIWVYLD